MDDLTKMQKFGLLVAKRRQSLDLSQEQVGKVFGASRQAVSQIESGKNTDITASTLFGIMKALKWTPEQLHAAYQGREPKDTDPNKAHLLQDSVKAFIFEALDLLPEADIEQALKVYLGPGQLKRKGTE